MEYFIEVKGSQVLKVSAVSASTLLMQCRCRVEDALVMASKEFSFLCLGTSLWVQRVHIL